MRLAVALLRRGTSVGLLLVIGGLLVMATVDAGHRHAGHRPHDVRAHLAGWTSPDSQDDPGCLLTDQGSEVAGVPSAVFDQFAGGSATLSDSSAIPPASPSLHPSFSLPSRAPPALLIRASLPTII